jgi:hypothetical protein
MSEQESQTAIPQRPTTDDRDEWKAYWMAQGMPWRTEPEIDEERQRQLNSCRVFLPEISAADPPAFVLIGDELVEKPV